MARPLRILYPGAWYHVMNRGAARATVFREPADIRDFLSLLDDLAHRFAVEVHAYCVMGNHYHALLRTPEPNLPAAMRHLNGVLTQRLHRRRNSDGPIFRGRFRSVLVQADSHLLQVTRYIHLNPVEAGLAKRPEDWPWSSYRGYLDPRAGPGWLVTRTVLASFGPVDPFSGYRDFVEAGLDRETRQFYDPARIPAVLGDEAFRDRVRRDTDQLSDEIRRELPQIRDSVLRLPLSTIAGRVARAFDLPSLDRGFRKGRVSKKVAIARGAFVVTARDAGGWRLHEIADWLGYASYTGPAQAAARFLQAATTDRSLLDRLRGVKSSPTLEAPENKQGVNFAPQ